MKNGNKQFTCLPNKQTGLNTLNNNELHIYIRNIQDPLLSLENELESGQGKLQRQSKI